MSYRKNYFLPESNLEELVKLAKVQLLVLKVKRKVSSPDDAAANFAEPGDWADALQVCQVYCAQNLPLDEEPGSTPEIKAKRFLERLKYKQLTTEFYVDELSLFVNIVRDMKRGAVDFCVFRHNTGTYSIWRRGLITEKFEKLTAWRKNVNKI